MNAILDWIYPKKCLECGSWEGYICTHCQQGIGRRGASLRYEGVVRKSLKEIKYRGTYDLVAELVEIWNPTIRDQYAVSSDRLLVTAVPMWVGKQRKRGYNQAELIGREVAKRWGVGYQDLLVRNRDTKPMFGLSRKARLDNIRNAFRLNPKLELLNLKQNQNLKLKYQDKIVALIDDVSTSGATINECASVLKRAGWEKVVCMALAC
jgi:competence protein ComFC